MKCPIANPNCPIKNGSKSPPCTEAGCTYSGGNPLAATAATVAIFGAIAAGGYFIFKDKIDPLFGAKPSPTSTTTASSPSTPTTTNSDGGNLSTQTPLPTPDVATIESIDTSQPNPQVLTMDGSVTMVKMIKMLRNGYAQINPNMPTTYGFAPNGQPKDGEDVRPTGSGSGLKNLMNGKVLMVATSRPLKPDEAQVGIKAIPIARDVIAIVVGKDNPFQGGLTKNQLRDIYTGKITNWSEVGGTNLPIKAHLGLRGKWYSVDTIIGDMVGL